MGHVKGIFSSSAKIMILNPEHQKEAWEEEFLDFKSQVDGAFADVSAIMEGCLGGEEGNLVSGLKSAGIDDEVF